MIMKFVVSRVAESTDRALEAHDWIRHDSPLQILVWVRESHVRYQALQHWINSLHLCKIYYLDAKGLLVTHGAWIFVPTGGLFDRQSRSIVLLERCDVVIADFWCMLTTPSFNGQFCAKFTSKQFSIKDPPVNNFPQKIENFKTAIFWLLSVRGSLIHHKNLFGPIFDQ